MRRSVFIGAGVVAAVAALALLPAVSSGGPGKLVGKDTGKGSSPVAVATATVGNPGKLSFVITAKPSNKKVQWNYTTDCVKGDEEAEFPPPGTAEDKVDKPPIRKKIRTGGLRNPDSCDIAVSAKLKFESSKRVTAKIFNK